MSLDGVDLNFWGTAPSTLNVHAPTTTQPYSFSSSLPDPPLPVDDEPLYVNAKQYYRILKRRVARARLEEVHRLSRQRKPYLHESRHKHAMRRPRGPGGRFLTAEEIAAQKASSGDDAEGDDVESPENMVSPVDTQPQQHHQQHPHMQQNVHRDPNNFMSSDMNVINIPYTHNHNQSLHHQHQHSSLSIAISQQSKLPTAAPPHHLFSHGPQGSPITLSSPYPIQMHHVPHPHAHARHRHSQLNYAQGLYPDQYNAPS
ncbi:CCAAT-binding transcription factor (CBF-B/NF-YA) subunit B-domain-containing protein [Mucidula mucida]|nr:CCAAT-binding transcription factor (CBF-B/NF-YA) subunit B-domain-containing protein [Mucidula mucida]